MASYRLDLNDDAKCVECGKGGATGSGVCLACAAKVIGNKPLKSAKAKALRVKFRGQRHADPMAAVASFNE